MTRGQLALRLAVLFALGWLVTVIVFIASGSGADASFESHAVLAVLAPALIAYGAVRALFTLNLTPALGWVCLGLAPYAAIIAGLQRPDVRARRWLAYGGVVAWWLLLSWARAAMPRPSA